MSFSTNIAQSSKIILNAGGRLPNSAEASFVKSCIPFWTDTLAVHIQQRLQSRAISWARAVS
jgi:hypothetical protein